MSMLKEHPSATEPPVPQQNNTLSLALITGLLVCVYTCDSGKLRYFVLSLLSSVNHPSAAFLSLSLSLSSVFLSHSIFFCLLVTCTVECLTLLNTLKMLSLPVGGKSFLSVMSLTLWPIYKIFLLLRPSRHTNRPCAHSKCKNPI